MWYHEPNKRGTKEDYDMFEQGFPKELSGELHKVLGVISKQTYNNISQGCSEESGKEEYVLSDGSSVSFPYRIYYIDDEHIYDKLDSSEEKRIYDCIFSRSYDGYVRERHLKNLLTEDMPEWCMPYILKLSAEYVKEIVEDIYVFMSGRDNSKFQEFCELNPQIVRYAYSRMTNYWNEFYRCECFRFHNYVGYKLYKECLMKAVRNHDK